VSYSGNNKGGSQIGDAVSFDYGGLTIVGRVVEDRGPIGVGGRRLFRVRVEMEAGADPTFIELPETALSVIKHVA
jgi:hypothetical protein